MLSLLQYVESGSLFLTFCIEGGSLLMFCGLSSSLGFILHRARNLKFFQVSKVSQDQCSCSDQIYCVSVVNYYFSISCRLTIYVSSDAWLSLHGNSSEPKNHNFLGCEVLPLHRRRKYGGGERDVSMEKTW